MNLPLIDLPAADDTAPRPASPDAPRASAASDITAAPASPTLARSAPLHVVINRDSGASGGSGTNADRALTAMLVDELARSDRALHWHPSGAGDRLPQAAARAATAARDSGGVVVAVGGDGTLAAVAREAIAAGVPMGVLPVGTFNLFARAQGIPLEPRAAARRLLDLQTRRVAVGWAGDASGDRERERPFLVSASLGLHPDLIDARERDTARFGRDRRIAMLSGWLRLWSRRRRLALRMEADGDLQAVEASTVLVTNNPVQLAAMGARVPGRPGDDLDALRVLVVPPLHGSEWLPLVWQAATGRLRENEGVREWRAQTLTIGRRRGRRPLKLALDGEVSRIAGPLRLRFDPQGLTLVGRPAAGDV